jgi:demethylmenaquinone methyltransferase / 2-methoxy-6-polyprenyl-1,4-benzoquinol methylase
VTPAPGRAVAGEQPLPTGAAKVATVRAMVDRIAPRYDLLNRLMTFGLDLPWRRRAVRALGLAPGATVLDVACGTGDLCRELRRRDLRSVGMDLSLGMLQARHPQTPVVQADASCLPLADASVDGATCGFALRNVADLDAVVGEIARVVRPGGALAVLEVDVPQSRLLRAGHRVWFQRGVPALGALLSDAEAYRYLPRSVAYLPAPH